MEVSEGKLKSLTLEEKVKLIDIVESGRPVKDVAEEFSVNRNTLHYILKNRDKIRSSLVAKPGISGFKRIKQTKCPELEQKVLDFMNESRARNEKVSGNIIKTVALEFAAELQVFDFSASNGWLFSFFKRNKIVISEFNKGIENVGGENQSQFANIVKSSEVNLKEDEKIEENLSKSEVEEDLVEISYDYIESGDEKAYLTEIIEQDEEMEEETTEISEEVQELPWLSWCRMCGSRETLPSEELQHGEIVQQLLNIPQEIEIRVCNECQVALEDISRMIIKGRNVESMFQELQERETTVGVTEDDLTAIRRVYGFEAEIEDEEELPVEEENYEEVIYEDIESLAEEFEPLKEEFIEYEEVVEAEKPENPHEYNFECHICGETFERMFFLSNHTRNQHQSLPKVACSCGRYLSTWDSLMAHRKKHAPQDSSFSCDLCDSSFRTKTGLSIHIKFKHEKPQKSHCCDQCGRQFKDATVLKAHIRTHLPDEQKYIFECEICNKRMVNKWSLKYHISTIHDRVINHFCHLCGRGFGNKSNLRSHLISHSTENVECEICGGRFKNRVSLQSHRKVHNPERSKNFSCPTCKKMFHNLNHLTRHLVAHSEERKFKCHHDNCNHEYKWEKDLKNHLASFHTGLKAHKCGFCERTFADSGNLRRHKIKEHSKDLELFELEKGRKRKFE